MPKPNAYAQFLFDMGRKHCPGEKNLKFPVKSNTHTKKKLGLLNYKTYSRPSKQSLTTCGTT